MTSVVLDASALIALIYEEQGHEIVERHLPSAIISTVNLAETVSYMVKQGNAVETAHDLLQNLALQIIGFDEKQAYHAAMLISKTARYGLSLGDRACLALAFSLRLPVVTADKAWKQIGAGVQVELIR